MAEPESAAGLEDLTPDLWARLTPLERDWARYWFNSRLTWLAKHRPKVSEAEAQRSAVVFGYRSSFNRVFRVAALAIIGGVVLVLVGRGRLIEIVPGTAVIAVGAVLAGLAVARGWQVERYLKANGWRKKRA